MLSIDEMLMQSVIIGVHLIYMVISSHSLLAM